MLIVKALPTKLDKLKPRKTIIRIFHVIKIRGNQIKVSNEEYLICMGDFCGTTFRRLDL